MLYSRDDTGLVISTVESDLSAQGIDFTKPGYRRGWRLMTSVAGEMDVEVTGTDITHWVMNFGMMRAIDELVDNHGITDVTEPLHLVISGRAIEGVTSQEASVFAELVAGYGEEQKEDVLEGYLTLPSFADKRLSAVSVSELMGVNIAESASFARILKIDPKLEPNIFSQLAARNRFNRWVEQFSRAGYLADSCFDLRKDYLAGNVAIPPSLGTRSVMFSRAVAEVIRATRGTPIRTMGTLALTAFKMNAFERAS